MTTGPAGSFRINLQTVAFAEKKEYLFEKVISVTNRESFWLFQTLAGNLTLLQQVLPVTHETFQTKPNHNS